MPQPSNASYRMASAILASEKAASVRPPLDDDQLEQIEFKKKVDLLRKVRSTRERLYTMGAVTNQDPSKVYVWVANDDETQVRFVSLGYEVCKDPNISTSWKKEDGSHRRGDLILYQIDKDIYDALRTDSAIRAIEVLESPEDQFLQFAEKSGVPAHKLEKK